MKINLLQIINGYWNRKLYSLLVGELSEKGLFQTVFVPLRNKKDKGKFFLKKENIKFLYAYIIKSVIYRILFWLKIYKSVKYIERNADLQTFDISHAHTLFSDGAVSLSLFKKYKIPYVITVRNTDLNIFYKYLFYLRPLGKKIVLNAGKIIFLSESYRQRMFDYYSGTAVYDEIERKSVVIPNGIDDFWHKNSDIEIKKKNKNDLFTFVFAGEFKKNKNIHSVIKSIDLLRKKGYNCKFKVVGLGLNDDDKYVKSLYKQKYGKDYIEFIPAVKKEKLAEIYRTSDVFIMPSFKESFGLVYAEALSQGLPVIYTENEGFDKNFENGFIGYAVNPLSINDIAEKSEKLILNFDNIRKNCKTASEKFKWKNISKDLTSVYLDVISD